MLKSPKGTITVSTISLPLDSITCRLIRAAAIQQLALENVPERERPIDKVDQQQEHQEDGREDFKCGRI